MRSLFSFLPLIFLFAGIPFSKIAFAESQPPDLANTVHIAVGERRFNQNCVYCHGNAGSGGKGAPLQGRDDLTPQYLFETISNGKKRGSLVMPAWKEAFTEQEIWELSAYILSLRNITSKK